MTTKNHKAFIKLVRHFVGEYGWRRRNTIFIVISIFFSYAILTSQYVNGFILSLGDFGYMGSFIVGMFFSYALTAIPATVGLFLLGENLNPLLIALVGAAGAVISDFIIFRFVKDNLVNEMEELPTLKKGMRLLVRNVKKSKFLRDFIPIIAGFIIASPLPDELGITLLGMTRFQPKKFLAYSYFFNFIGIFIITSAAKVL